ncbi:hypothetical protein HDU98_001754 [Podochytrium sp. JEL0797]|nr:hypothetical protein HDU98_001754 [Podochytrium sp. JEL0797]
MMHPTRSTLLKTLALLSLRLETSYAYRIEGGYGNLSPNARGASLSAVLACSQTFPVTDPNGMTCAAIQAATGLTVDTLQSFNSELDCSKLVPLHTFLCVVAPSTGTDNLKCLLSYTTMAQDSCSAIESAFDLDDTTFGLLNPSVQCTSLASGDNVCLEAAVNGNSQTTLGGPLDSSTPVAVSHAANCNSFQTVASPTACLDIVTAAAISITNLVSWNGGLNCWGLKQNDTLCVGVGSAASATVNTVSLPPATSAVTTSSSASSTAAVVPSTTAPSPPPPPPPAPVAPSPSPVPVAVQPAAPVATTAASGNSSPAPAGGHPEIPFNTGASPGNGASYVTSWHWFVGNSFDCDGSITADQYNTGFYAGAENIPGGCGTTGTFTYNGNSVTVKFIWRTTGGSLYHELSAAAFAQLIGSGAQVSPGMSSTDFQIAINDPGRVMATCSGAHC